jgi:hypothetical protein
LTRTRHEVQVLDVSIVGSVAATYPWEAGNF